jgi:hypothetical protein
MEGGARGFRIFLGWLISEGCSKAERRERGGDASGAPK